MDNCLYIIKNKNYIWIKIGLIALIPWLYMALKWLLVLQIKGSEALMGYLNYIWGSLLLIPFILIPIVSKHKYSTIKLYADKLVVKGMINFELEYNEIKTISRRKKVIYLLGKDYEEDNKEYISLDTDKKYGTLMYKYSYNKLIVMPNTSEIYKKIIEIIGEKENKELDNENINSTQIFTHINNIPYRFTHYFLIVIGSISASFLCFFITMLIVKGLCAEYLNKWVDIALWPFVIIGSIMLFLLFNKFIKIKDGDIVSYEIYRDYILGITKKKSQIIKPINYRDVLKVQVSIAATSMSPKNVNVAIWYLSSNSNNIERIVLYEINEDNGKMIIDLIRNAKNIKQAEIDKN